MAITEEKLKEMIEHKAKVERISTISSDGVNLLTRIPKEIAEEAKMQKKDKLRWLLDKEIKLEVIKENDKEKEENS